MTTSRQEQIYNEIVKYYDFADKLLNIIEDTENQISPEQMKIVESAVEDLEKYADQLTTNFIEFVKEGNSEEIKENLAYTLNEIIVKIEQCRNQVYMLHSYPELKT